MMYYYYPPFYPPKIPQGYQSNFIHTKSSQNYSKHNNTSKLGSISTNDDTNLKRAEKNDTAFSDNTVLFEILGIKLYFDDLLLICLIFFLYTEGVQDQILFIALILLLLG